MCIGRPKARLVPEFVGLTRSAGTSQKVRKSHQGRGFEFRPDRMDRPGITHFVARRFVARPEEAHKTRDPPPANRADARAA